jgi:hypothetical protein
MRYAVLSLIFGLVTTWATAQNPTKGTFTLAEVKELMAGPKSAIETNLKRKGFTMYTLKDDIYIYEKKGTPIDVRFKLTDGIVTLIAWQELKKYIGPIINEIEAEKWEFPINKEGNAFRDPNTGMKFMVFPYEGNPALIKVFVGM